MSVALELRRAAQARRRTRLVRGHRPDRDDDRGLGRGGRPADQRLRPGHRRVARRGGRSARRLGHRRGPGFARPPGLLVGDARAHPRRHAARDGHGPQAGTGRARLRPPARGRRSRSRRCRASSSSTSGSPGWSRPSKVVGVALNTSLYPDDDEARRVIDAIAAETGLPTDDPFRFGRRPAVGGDPGAGRCAAVGRRQVTPAVHATRCSTSGCATRSGSPARTTVPDTGDDGHRRDPRRPVPRTSSGWGRATRTGSTARRPETMAAVVLRGRSSTRRR